MLGIQHGGLIKLRVLIVEAHPDDGVGSCGGTICKMLELGFEVKMIYFCPCDEDPLNSGHLEDHARALKILGLSEMGGYKIPRDIAENHKQEIRDALWKIKEEYQPQLVICPNPHDFHQDHRAVGDCCLTIFRDVATILGFEVWRSSNYDFHANLFVKLEERHVDTKLRALSQYRTQLERRSKSFKLGVFQAGMVARGAQILEPYAEAFEFLWGKII